MSIKFNSIKTHITIVLLLMVLLPTLTIGWMTHSVMSGYIRSDRISDVGRVAKTKHEQLAMVLSQANRSAEHLLSELDKQCGGNSARLSHRCATGLIGAYLTTEGAIGANLYRKGGGDNLTIGASAVRQGDSVVFPDGQLAKFSSTGPTSDHSYFVSVTNEPHGLHLSITYPSSALEHIFNPYPADLGLSGETFLTDGEGYFATTTRYASTQGHIHPITARPMQTCLSGQSHEMLDLDYREAEIIHGFRFIPELGSACIMAHITQDEAFAPLQSLQRQIAIAIFLFGVLLIMATVNLAGRIVKPVTRFTEAARTIAEGNYQVRTDIKGGHELAELAATFNHMANRLHETQKQLLQNEAELRQLNIELEQRVAERTRQLVAANEELEAFNYSVAHDLRSPLRGISGFSLVLSNKYHGQLDATARGWLERINRASQHMGRLIDDMLQLAKVSRSTLKLEQVDLSKLAENIADELKKTKPERQARFVIQPGLSAQADPGLLRIVMDNLLGNAWKFTGKKPAAEIEFGTRDIGGQRAFIVRDNGEGFNMEHANQLFGAFQRLHATSEFEGTGIGLATVQRIIHRHHGKVWAEAKEGAGATFYFTLPQNDPEPGGQNGH